MSKTDSAIHKLAKYYIQFRTVEFHVLFLFTAIKRGIYSLHGFRTVYNGLVLSGWDSKQKDDRTNCSQLSTWCIMVHEVVPIVILHSHLRFTQLLRLLGQLRESFLAL